MPERVAIEEAPPLPPDSGQLKGKSTFWPILVTIVGGIGLAYGSFYAACSPEARNSDFTRAFGWALGPALLLGVLAALFGTVWLIMALLLHVFYFLKTKSRD